MYFKKKKKLVNKIGISVYDTEVLKKIIKNLNLILFSFKQMFLIDPS